MVSDISTGALVSKVTSESPAATSGVLPGDVIVGLNGQEIGGAREIVAFVDILLPGDAFEVTVFRSGEYLVLTDFVGLRQDLKTCVRAEMYAT